MPLQIFLGDQHGLNTLAYQPAKLAAIEARWDTVSRAPLTLFAIPDEKAETNRYEIAVPDLGSLILTHELNGTVRPQRLAGRSAAAGRGPVLRLPRHGGPRDDHAGDGDRRPVAARARPAVRLRLVFAPVPLVSPLGFVAVLAGWITTEVGRQPWTVYGLLRTADLVSPSLTGRDVVDLADRLRDRLPGDVSLGPALMARIVRAGPSEAASGSDRSRAVGRRGRSRRCRPTIV